MSLDIYQIAEAFCSHRFAVTYPYMADEIKWSIVGKEELVGREAVIDRCDKSAKFLETVSTTITKLKINKGGNMNKLHFSITINAPKAKVWSTMLDDATYRVWTEAFTAGSHYVGDWSQGSKILFLGPDPKTGKMGGMVSRIKENRQHEYISIEHLGMVNDGKEDTTSEAVKAWAGAHENYTFKEKKGATEVLVDIDITEDFKEMFEGMWPKALQKLKELAEK